MKPLRGSVVCSTYARHRIRHVIRHTEALAERCHRPCIANEGLRYMPIGYARVSKADGPQSLDLQRDTSVSKLCTELGIKPVTLYRYVGPQGQLREQGEKVLAT